MNQDKNNIPEPEPNNAAREAGDISREEASNSPSFGGGRGDRLVLNRNMKIF